MKADKVLVVIEVVMKVIALIHACVAAYSLLMGELYYLAHSCSYLCTNSAHQCSRGPSYFSPTPRGPGWESRRQLQH